MKTEKRIQEELLRDYYSSVIDKDELLTEIHARGNSQAGAQFQKRSSSHDPKYIPHGGEEQ